MGHWISRPLLGDLMGQRKATHDEEAGLPLSLVLLEQQDRTYRIPCNLVYRFEIICMIWRPMDWILTITL